MTNEIALHCMKSASELERELCEECSIYGQTGCDHCYEDALQYVIAMLEQESCEDCISREHLLEEIASLKESPWFKDDTNSGMAIRKEAIEIVEDLCIRKEPSVNPQEPKIGHCKDCKYFEYDSVAKVGGIPLIVAHEICNKWGDGCKTSEEGFCFLFEPQESEVDN